MKSDQGKSRSKRLTGSLPRYKQALPNDFDQKKTMWRTWNRQYP